MAQDTVSNLKPASCIWLIDLSLYSLFGVAPHIGNNSFPIIDNGKIWIFTFSSLGGVFVTYSSVKYESFSPAANSTEMSGPELIAVFTYFSLLLEPSGQCRPFGRHPGLGAHACAPKVAYGSGLGDDARTICRAARRSPTNSSELVLASSLPVRSRRAVVRDSRSRCHL